MTDSKKIVAVRDLIESAQKSITTARKILSTMGDDEMTGDSEVDMSGLQSYKSGPNKIVE